jgi:hypothetical protein
MIENNKSKMTSEFLVEKVSSFDISSKRSVRNLLANFDCMSFLIILKIS